jgi:hypothetical protein
MHTRKEKVWRRMMVLLYEYKLHWLKYVSSNRTPPAKRGGLAGGGTVERMQATLAQYMSFISIVPV